MTYSVQLLWTNNAQTTLAGNISNTSLVANLASGSGVLFPNPGANQGFTGTFTDAATGLLHEIVLVTGRSGDTVTMVRAQEGTTALNWSANDLFANLWTQGAASSLVQQYQLQNQASNYAADTGITNGYVVGLLPAVSTAPSAGMPVRVKIKAGNSNTGPSTLNAGWGAAAIVRRDGSALIGGELVGDFISEFFWNDAGQFEWHGLAPATSAAITTGTDTQSAVTPAQLANASSASPGSLQLSAALSAPSGFLLGYGQAISRVTFATLFGNITRSSNVAISIATPGVVTWAAHGLSLGDVISFETTGALPTGLIIATNYYAVPIDANTFNVATSAANALVGTLIATSGSQSGTQTCRLNPYGCGNGTTTFNVPDGRDVTFAGWTAMGGVARNILGSNASVGGFATAAMGNFAGQKAHAPTIAETAAHTHSMNGVSGSNAASTGGPVQGSGAADVTGSTGSGNSFNVTQPTLLVNVFIKT